MTELSASAGSEGYAACDDEAKDMQLATKLSADPHRPLEPTKCRMHFVGEEEQRND